MQLYSDGDRDLGLINPVVLIHNDSKSENPVLTQLLSIICNPNEYPVKTNQ